MLSGLCSAVVNKLFGEDPLLGQEYFMMTVPPHPPYSEAFLWINISFPLIVRPLVLLEIVGFLLLCNVPYVCNPTAVPPVWEPLVYRQCEDSSSPQPEMATFPSGQCYVFECVCQRVYIWLGVCLSTPADDWNTLQAGGQKRQTDTHTDWKDLCNTDNLQRGRVWGS